MSHFNPQFLFIAGDPNYRHGAGVGTLYWIMLPLIIAGLLYLITANIPRRYKIFIVFWILIFPLGGSLTNDGVPHATRTLPGAPLLCMLSAAGFGAIFNFIKFKSGKAILSHGFALIMIGISLLSLGVFTRYYFSEYPIKSNGAWGYGHKKIFSTIKSLQDDYQRVCMENLNYTNELQLIRYYLPDTHLVVMPDLNNFECFKRGSIIVQWAGNKKKRRMRLVETVNDLEGRVIYNIYVID